MEAVIGGAFGFAGSALSQMAEGHGFNARKAWGAAANGAIVGAARGALIGSGAGIPLAFGVDFAAGMAGSLAEQKISGARIAPVRAAVDGAFNAAGGRLYGTSPLKNVKNAFIRGALEGAVKGGAYNIADVLDNRLRNAYNARKRQKLRTTRRRNTWNKKNKNPWNSRNPRPTGSRSPQSHCGKPKPLKGMRNPKRRRSSRDRRDRAYHALPNDRFRIRSFVRDVVAGAVMGGLSSAAFYGAGKAVEALKRINRKSDKKSSDLLLDLNLQYFSQKSSNNYAKLRNTKNIRYSQKSINPYFDNGCNVNELIAYLKADPFYAKKVDPIRLVKFKNLPTDVQKKLKLQEASSFTVFSLDNRRLYAAKMAGVKVNSRWATQQDLDNINLIRRFSTTTVGKTIQVR